MSVVCEDRAFIGTVRSVTMTLERGGMWARPVGPAKGWPAWSPQFHIQITLPEKLRRSGGAGWGGVGASELQLDGLLAGAPPGASGVP